MKPLLHLKTATVFFCPAGARGLCINCVTAFRVSSSAAGVSCTGLKCHAYYEFNTAKRSFIHVCLLIALFSILVFVKGSLVFSLRADDNLTLISQSLISSARRLPYFGLFGIRRSQLPAIAALLACKQFY